MRHPQEVGWLSCFRPELVSIRNRADEGKHKLAVVRADMPHGCDSASLSTVLDEVIVLPLSATLVRVRCVLLCISLVLGQLKNWTVI